MTGLGIGLVFGLVVTAMIYAVGHISGAHHPAVTVAFFSAGRILDTAFPAGVCPHVYADIRPGVARMMIMIAGNDRSKTSHLICFTPKAIRSETHPSHVSF